MDDLSRILGSLVRIINVKMKLKICQISDIETASKLVRMGVDYLGFHIIDKMDMRRVEKIASINVQLRKNGYSGGTLLTKINNPADVVKLAKYGHFQYLQMHRNLNLSQIEYLADALHHNGIKYIQVIDPESKSKVYVNCTLNLVDYVLYDNYEGGTGRQIPEHNLVGFPMSRAFLAGGINDVKALEIKKQHNPYAIDVQSWVHYDAVDFSKVSRLLSTK